jgi:hypothetical protein
MALGPSVRALFGRHERRIADLYRALFVLKDWGKSATPIHWLCHAGDRWLTGDRVSHLVPAEARRLVARHIPQLKLLGDERIRPWRNNYALVFAC